MCVRIDGNVASATKRDAVGVVTKRSNLVRTIFAVLFTGWLGQPALAQTLPNPTGLPEAWLKPNPTGLTAADIAPCDDLLSIRTGRDPTDLSNLDFALSMPPYAVRQGGHGTSRTRVNS